MPEGIRKINEFLFQPGRTLTVTDSKIDFANFENGTLLVDKNGNIKVKKDNVSDWSKFEPINVFNKKSFVGDFLIDGAITTVQLSDLCVTTPKINNNAVTTPKIQDNAIVANKILDGEINNNKIALSTITSDRLVPRTIVGSNIHTLSIDTEHLIDDSVKTAKIKNNAVTSDKIPTDNILSRHIYKDSITTVKILDDAVTSSKILKNNILEKHILDGEIKTGKIANLAVTTGKIANLNITTEKLNNEAVTTEKIKNAAVTSDKIKNDSITTAKIINYAVSAEKLSSALNDAIYRAIKLEATGVATVEGNLTVRNNISAGGTITAHKVYNAVYNDLAEGYVPGEHLEPGDIVEVKEDGKVYKARPFSNAIVGVISNEYAECYGATEEEILSGKKVAVGLIGKIHVNVSGPVQIGRKIICTGKGIGTPSSMAQEGCVGKALETIKEDGIHKVLCLVFPN